MASHREEIKVHRRAIIREVDSGPCVSLINANLVSPSDIVPGKTLTTEQVGRHPFEVQVAHLPIEWRGRGMCPQKGVMEDAPAPLLMGRDIMGPKHMSAAWENVIEPLRINAVTRSQSKKVETVGEEASQSPVTQLAMGARGTRGKNPPNCRNQLAAEGTDVRREKLPFMG